MNFFKNKTVKIIAWILLALSIVVLILGGTTAEAITTSVGLVAAIIAAVSALIAFITERIKE